MDSSAIKVAASPLRCPFCLDGVEPEGEPWTACGSCLGRHHAECWGEAGACSTCRSATPLVRGAATVPVVPVVRLVRIPDAGPRRSRARRARARHRRYVLGAFLVASILLNAAIVAFVVIFAEGSAIAPFVFSIF
jgi:hypothetical protein